MTKEEHLNEVAQQVIYDCEYMRIPYGKIVDFTVNTRAKKRWGQCKRAPDGFHINVNEVLCDGEHDTGLRSTLFHEIIHTCPNCFDHKQEWKHWAEIIREHTGLNIKRTATSMDYGVADYETAPKPKYKLICKQCGGEHKYMRKGKAVQYYKYFRCGVCHGDLRLEVLR